MKLAKLILVHDSAEILYDDGKKVNMLSMIMKTPEYKRYEAYRYTLEPGYKAEDENKVLEKTGADFIPRESNYIMPNCELLARKMLMDDGYEIIHSYPIVNHNVTTFCDIYKKR